jgi:hypothetical protein
MTSLELFSFAIILNIFLEIKSIKQVNIINI